MRYVQKTVHVYLTALNLYELMYKWRTPVRTVHFSDARGSLKTVIDQVVDDADVTLITRRDAPNAVIMSQDFYDSLMETVHLLRSPANVAHLERSIAQLRKGKAKERKLTEDDE